MNEIKDTDAIQRFREIFFSKLLGQTERIKKTVFLGRNFRIYRHLSENVFQWRNSNLKIYPKIYNSYHKITLLKEVQPQPAQPAISG